MAITPQTNIRLLKLPFTLDNKNQLTFSTLSAQTNYFTGLSHLEMENATYQRKDNVIRYNAHIDDIINYNYVMYQNEAYSNKWFYAFIINMRYVNDNLTEIEIQTDYFQTWQFDIVYHNMFVEREHVNDDTVGAHTIPENLETGEYKIDQLLKYNFNSISYIVQATEYITETSETPIVTNFGGVPYAGTAYICSNLTQLANVLQGFQGEKIDSIINVYMCPTAIIQNSNESLEYSGQNDAINLEYSLVKPTSLDGYTPKNKKLLTFPYCFLNVSNNNGSINSYLYELFNTSNCRFVIKGVPVVGASIKCCPYEYKNSGESINEDEGLMCGKFPTLSWSKDAFTNWLTQNSVNIGIGVASDLLNIISGAGLMLASPATAPAGASSIVNSGVSIANTIGSVYQHSLTPNTAKGNTNGGDINSCTDTNSFFFYQMSIREEYAKIIDDFFSMYGYKVNQLKTPNVTGRQNWNYVKTIGCNITGNFPQQDLQALKDMFDNGVTFWHNSSTFLNYSSSNNIV